MKKIKLQKSKRFLLNFFDVVKGAIVAGTTGAATLLYQQIESGSFDLKTAGTTAALGAVGYLVKNVFEGDGKTKKLPTE